MTEPNMSTTTSSLEKSLQNFSLSNHHPPTSSCSSSGSNGGGSGGARGGGISRTSSSDLVQIQQHDNDTSDISYELNSHIRMPYHWEQCLDLKTGELYYINWKTGMKSKEDPRTTTRSSNWNVEIDDSVEIDDGSSYESEGSTTEESSFPQSSIEQKRGNIMKNERNDNQSSMEEEHVLVVAGCKNCYMYLMVPKLAEDCPKCTGQLIHFASP